MVYMDTQLFVKRVLAKTTVDKEPNFYTGTCCHICSMTPSQKYALITVGFGHVMYAHRIVYLHHNEDFDINDTKLLVRHLCGNPRCVRIDHLVEGSHSDNAKDTRNMSNGRTQRLENSDIEDIRGWIKLGLTNVDIADMYDMSDRAISSIRTREHWVDV